jgi:PAS domain S-box-containing protein
MAMPDRHAPLTEAPARKPWRRALAIARVWLPVATVFAIGLAVTAVAFLMTNRAEEQRVVKGLEFRIEWRAKDLQAKVDLAREALLATAVHTGSDRQIDVADFDHFTSAAAARSRSIESISWATPVTREQRAEFEVTSGFPITENDATGTRRAAAERTDYMPIVVQKRFEDRLPFLGFDLMAAPGRRLAMETARDAGMPKATTLPEYSSATNPRFVVFWPIFNTDVVPEDIAQRRALLRGYLAGIFRIVNVLNGAIADTPDIPETLNFYLSNDTAEMAPDSSFRLVATYSPTDHTIRPAHAPASDPVTEYAFTRSFNVTGQQWRIKGLFSPQAVAAERSIGPLVLLIAGPLLTAVLAAYVVGGIRQVSVVQTLVDQRTAELRQTHTKLEALINASPFAITGMDAERRVILWNAAAEQLFGYTAEEVLGRPYPVAPEQQEEFEQRFKRMAAGEVLRNVASRRRRRDGTVIDTSLSAAAFYDAAGGLLGIVFAVEDTRERTRVQDQLRQAQKMEAVGQLTGGLAHDFNNLLAIIHGNLELLEDQDGLAPLAAELIDDALKATKRGASLTHRLLAYSRQQQLAPSAVDVGALVTNLIGMLRRVVEATITIETDIASDLWTSRIDPQQLENALLNLTINARDAMPDGGMLTIAAENVALDEEDSQQYAEVTPGRYVLLSVSDTGAGMPKDVLDRVLEPFFTTKPVGSGSGLGLSMVYGFVKQSGGHLTIYSEPGLGTSVKLYLPQLQSESVAVSIEADKPASASSDEWVILVVEDESSVRKLQLRVLGSLGYRTLEAADGPSGLIALNGAARVDLLLTDIVMPGGMSGPELAEAARVVRPDLKVLFMSGYAPTIVTQRYNLSGAHVLSKPFSRSTLAQAVWQLLEERTTK